LQRPPLGLGCRRRRHEFVGPKLRTNPREIWAKTPGFHDRFLGCLLMHQFHPISSPFGVPLKHFSTPLDSDGSFGLCAACIRFVSFLVAREPSVLPAPDQCIAISGLPYSENDACPKKCCPGTPGVPAKSPLFFNRLRGRQACIRWIVSSSIKPYLETGKGYILSN